ncbi:MAG: hypothetical protein ACO3FA_00875 [Vulcanococcus sp.]|jgi:hypothetical protein
MTPEQIAIYAALALAIGSEILALFPNIKANSWTQLLIMVLTSLAAGRQK